MVVDLRRGSVDSSSASPEECAGLSAAPVTWPSYGLLSFYPPFHSPNGPCAAHRRPAVRRTGHRLQANGWGQNSSAQSQCGARSRTSTASLERRPRSWRSVPEVRDAPADRARTDARRRIAVLADHDSDNSEEHGHCSDMGTPCPGAARSLIARNRCHRLAARGSRRPCGARPETHDTTTTATIRRGPAPLSWRPWGHLDRPCSQERAPAIVGPSHRDRPPFG